MRRPGVCVRFVLVAALIGLATIVNLLPSLAEAQCLTGDIDGNGVVDVVDVQCQILVVLTPLAGGSVEGLSCYGKSGEPSSPDANCDGTANVADVLIVNALALDLELPTLLDANGNGVVDGCPQELLCSGCTADIDCDDGDECTEDACTDGGCTWADLPNCPPVVEETTTWWCWASNVSGGPDPNCQVPGTWAPANWPVLVVGVPSAFDSQPPPCGSVGGLSEDAVKEWSCCPDGGGWEDPAAINTCDFSQFGGVTYTTPDLFQ